jgi:DNA-directed RNA polymerase subunit RPC12/RpoP
MGQSREFLGYKRVPFEKSVAVSHPHLVKEFHPTLNGSLLLSEIGKGSKKRVWWQCLECGHDWEAMIEKRAFGTGCPACVGLAANEKNCLAATHPDLAKEFDVERNGGLTPFDVVAGTNKRLWWKCLKCEHEWRTAGLNRKRGEGCLACSKRVDETNCMASTHPDLALQLHPTKNDSVDANNIVAGTCRRLWWKCQKCEHEWVATGNHRTRNGCPGCSNEVVTKSNCLGVVRPNLDREFIIDKNLPLTACDVVPGTHKKLWWRCITCGNDWRATGNARVSGKGCPSCSNGGFVSSQPGVLYVLCGIQYGKIGISNTASLDGRLTHHRQKGLFGPMVCRFDFPHGGDALSVETNVKRFLRERYERPDLPEGFTEAFPATQLFVVLERVVQRVDVPTGMA